MKKTIFFSLIICLIFLNAGNAQVGGFLKKVTKSVANDVLGKPEEGTKNKNSDKPEPLCACDQAEIVMDMGGKLQLDYSELNISISDDGRILAQDRSSKEYYIVQNGVTTGPVNYGDPRLAGFKNIENSDDSKKTDPWANNEYITKSGEKYLINFGGKNYGPYARIQDFTVTKSKDKFAAIVIENIPVSEADGKRMDQAIKNARSEQEKRDLAMKYNQEMMQKMQDGGGPTSIMPRLVTNIAGATYDPIKAGRGSINGNVKFDDIVVVAYDKIIDLQGKVILSLKPEAINLTDIFLNTTNTKYAFYTYGTLTFSDNTTMSELFNPHLIKVNGQVYLAYFYYSPKKNSIMQCKIPF
jgi:hypothetical protein